MSVKARPATPLRVLRGSLAAAAVVGVLALSGCATADTAAVVNGVRITEREAQEAARQIQQAQPDSTLDTPNAVAALIMAKFINATADSVGKGLSASAARAAVPAIVDPTPATLELVEASLAWNQLTSDEQAKAIGEASKAKITINPRYGTFDPKKISFDPSTPNWIKAEPTPAPQG
jgi:hypothetical protein